MPGDDLRPAFETKEKKQMAETTNDPVKDLQKLEAATAAKSAKALDAALKGTGYVVAPGKGLACPRGVVADGQPISVDDFADEAAFQTRMKEGYIVAAPKSEEKPADDKAKK